ncbi:MAG: phage Gp37/Gp68 family protein, partial [Desulfobacterales bacterium]|nr:phage Gp37/Gp68 family protein [Desulfobacterales bacterium]
MALNSEIEWTEATWNPTTGCTKISEGCKNCYAERMTKRLQVMGQPNYRNGFKLTLHDHMLDIPLRWKKSKMIFVNSMSDLFHEDVPLFYINKVMNVINKAKWHQFQILTKRSHRLIQLNEEIDWPPNAWIGVTVENDRYIYRIEHLLQTKAKIKFISMEPLLGPLNSVK